MFQNAIKNELKTFLLSKNLILSGNDSYDFIMNEYCNYLDKWIEPKKRKVVYSDNISSNTDFSSILSDFKDKFENGDDINGHLSKGIYKVDYYDKLLINWRIFHLHLNLTTANNLQQMSSNRSGDLLFFTMTDDTIYFIDVEKHSRQNLWSMYNLLETIERNWSFLLHQIEGVLSMQPIIKNDADIKKFFNANINLAYEINGKYYFPPALAGSTSAGTNLNIQLYLNKINRKLCKEGPKPPSNPRNVKVTLNYPIKNPLLKIEWLDGAELKELILP